jgi:hypothetical protein
MSSNDRRHPKSLPTSAPPEVSSIDTSWDDDTAPGLDLDDPLNEFDRVTAIPELPSELYAKKVMASVDDSRLPELPSEPPVHSARPLQPAQFTLDSAPPTVPRSPDSTAPRQALSIQNAETTRECGCRDGPAAALAFANRSRARGSELRQHLEHQGRATAERASQRP